MPSWDDLRVLLAVHRHGSLLAAGEALGVSTSTAARRIESLERSLGRVLVLRSSGGTRVEPDALGLIALAEDLELGLQALQRDERQGVVSGTLRVSMGEGFVGPTTQMLCQVRRRFPSLIIELVTESRFADLGRREVDLAIRVGKSTSAMIVERYVGKLTFGLYASKSYVDQRLRGTRLSPADFVRHDFVGLDPTTTQREPNHWLVSRGATRFVFRSNSDLARQTATQQGQGICLLPDAVAHQGLGLVRLDAGVEHPSAPVYLAFHRDRRRIPGVRVAIDELTAALKAALG